MSEGDLDYASMVTTEDLLKEVKKRFPCGICVLDKPARRDKGSYFFSNWWGNGMWAIGAAEWVKLDAIGDLASLPESGEDMEDL